MNETHSRTSKDVTVDELIDCSDEYLRQKYGTDKSDAAPGETLPVILERDFRHDPVEGEQGVLEMLVEIEALLCLNCADNRATEAFRGNGR